MWRSLFVCTLLASATVAVYGQAPRFDFVSYDDPQYVTEHPQVRAGLTAEGVAWAFSGVHLGNWHPLTTLSYMLDAELHGVNPGGFHLTNVVLHVLNTLLLFAVLRSMTGAFYRSALVAALFALHPVHVESVAWISERKDVLSTFFGFLCMALYVAYARRGGPGRYLLVALFLALSLMAKPMLVTLPLVFLLLDYWPLGRIARERAAGEGEGRGADRWHSDWRRMGPLVLEKLPLLVLSLAVSLVTMLVQRPASTESVPVPLRVANAIVSYVRYVWKALWPFDLGPLYPHPNLPGGTPWAVWQVTGAAVLLAVVTVLAIRARRRPYVLVGWLWYLGMLVPVIGIVQVGPQALADRYIYVPLIGIFLVAVWGWADLVGARDESYAGHRRLAPRLALVASGLLLAALGARAWHQARYWRSSLALLAHAVEVSPTSAVMHTSLGVALDRGGETDDAVQHYRRALAIDPQFAAAHTNLGIVLYGRGEVDQALRHYREALRFEPDSARAHNNLGIALQTHAGRAGQGAQGEQGGQGGQGGQVGQAGPAGQSEQASLDEAIDHYRRALEIEPGFAEAHNNLARAFQQQGKLDEAIHHYREALRVLPAVASIHAHLARALYAKGMVDDAIGHYRRAAELEPGDAATHNNLGYALHVRGQVADAIVHYRQALGAQPQYAEAHNNLGLALVDTGRMEDAIAHYRLALQIRPDYVNAHLNLGIALHSRGEIDEAIEHYRRALDLRPGYAPAQVNLERALRRRDAAAAAGAGARSPSE